METRVEKMADITILELRGEKLVESNAKDFKDDVAPVLTSTRKVIFDMSRLQFVDNSGLGVLLSCLRKLHAAGGELKLFGLTDQVRRLIELVRMHRIFDIYNTREEACRAYFG